jgi:hypothetical protein
MSVQLGVVQNSWGLVRTVGGSQSSWGLVRTGGGGAVKTVGKSQARTVPGWSD